MSTFTLKSIAQRGSLLVAAAGLLAATFAPAVFADALNPLTERSLLLSSSAPGWQDTDGSGYSTDNPNPGAATSSGTIPGTYAPAGAGANGRKTGQTFTFRISTPATAQAPIKAFSLQYCTDAAGLCQAPGDNLGDARSGATTPRETNAQGLLKANGSKTSDLHVNYPDTVEGDTLAGATPGVDFKIFLGDGVGTEISSYADWSLKTQNVEDDSYAPSEGNTGTLTGKNNYITLSSPTGLTSAAANQKVRIVFVASEDRYITNPGSGSFFVKMNTWSTDTVGAAHQSTDSQGANYSPVAVSGMNHVPGNANNIDGGVTVANVMADSIHITTKVLETMSFSVGTTNPDSVVLGNPDDHGRCAVIQTNNRIDLGNVNAENSLQTDRGYGANSYWRLSSNSSGGATVYYSGETLTNTVGDKIAPSPVTKTLSNPGNEQFGLAFDMDGADHKNIPTSDYSSSFVTALADINTGATTPYVPGLTVLNKSSNYADGHGELGVRSTGGNSVTPTALFAYDTNSVKNPVAIADNIGTGGVLGCETGKMRYVANIAPDTPAGVYTTKVNYLAAPQY